MKPNQASLTARSTARSRAAHQILDNPRLYDDPVAIKIIGAQASAKISSSPDSYQTVYATHLRAFLVARCQYAEQALSDALQQGVRQLVILGAGLDTFAYRNPHPPQLLQVFEVDHPATQAWKRERLTAAEIPIPESLRFVAIDFEKDSLADRLPQAGFKTDLPAFFSWLGVSMYLPAETVLGTLKSIANLSAPGSEIVFDYALAPDQLDPANLASFQARAGRVAAAGEPWKSTFEPEQLAAELNLAGFTVVDDLGSDGLNARFFNNRTDELRVAGLAHLIWIRTNQAHPSAER
jgi:methyltransferase (TIGR00027 family)